MPDNPIIGFTEEDARRLLTSRDRVEGSYYNQAAGPRPRPAQHPDSIIVRCTSLTPTGGLYPAVYRQRNQMAGTWSEPASCWILGLNSSAPGDTTSDNSGTLVDTNTDGLPVVAIGFVQGGDTDFYQIVSFNGVNLTQRGTLNFITSGANPALVGTDNASPARTNVTLFDAAIAQSGVVNLINNQNLGTGSKIINGQIISQDTSPQGGGLVIQSASSAQTGGMVLDETPLTAHLNAFDGSINNQLFYLDPVNLKVYPKGLVGGSGHSCIYSIMDSSGTLHDGQGGTFGGLVFTGGILTGGSFTGVTSINSSTGASLTLTGPSIITWSTASSTITGTLANQSANTVLVGPTSGAAAAPTFRLLVGQDIPPWAFDAFTGNTTLSGPENIYAEFTGSANTTLTLTNATVSTGQMIAIVNNGSAGTLTIATQASQTIGGATTQTAHIGDAFLLGSDGINWQIIAWFTPALQEIAFPVTVANGGTGDTSLTAFAVLCGGTTSTAPVQSVASLGTSGQALTSNGAGALPTFQNNAGGGQTTVTKTTFGFAAVQTAATTNTLNTITLPAGAVVEWVKVVVTTLFSGTGLSALTVSVGISTNHNKYLTSVPINATNTSAPNISGTGLPSAENQSASTQGTATFSCSGGNLSALTQGSVDIYIKYTTAT